MLGERQLAVLDRLLEYHSLRHRVVANNIANAEVPGYRAQDVRFSSELADAIRHGDVEDIRLARVEAHPVETDLGQVSEGLDVERQMGTLLKNKALFDTFGEAMNFRFRLLRAAMSK